ncbi:hypothetical protein pneo_cds_709 [Pandoravirus neocaledonia]|uniref:Uncharacterized protein n=1 Tax=Pandoravirus neocaledonia TaxID=2107708 RepID=A0A2U7UD03_9VIRU|nr:hypothetical protein pneo_cds_709 [Pandoravirus neocaledonia]AVK76316.1 hypothetical protein pneo_cds_709 [Pandoravirus neocaledonia]
MNEATLRVLAPDVLWPRMKIGHPRPAETVARMARNSHATWSTACLTTEFLC